MYALRRFSLLALSLLGLACTKEPEGGDLTSISEPDASRSPQAPSASGPTATQPGPDALSLPPRKPQDAPQSPAPTRSRRQATQADLEALNAWAKENALEQNLAAFAALGLPMQPELKSTVSIQYNRVEAPDAATVMVLQEGYLDDSLDGERFTLRFARKDCGAAPCDGAPPWVLFELSAEQRCKPGRGHQDYSSEVCN